MNGLLRSRYGVLVGRCLTHVWRGLVALGALHIGSAYYDEARVMAALGQVGCFLDGGTTSGGRTPGRLMLEELQDGAGTGGPGSRNS
ncbi:hypothetical protein ACWEWI_17905 [Streptomyces sp. NPDC003753]